MVGCRRRDRDAVVVFICSFTVLRSRVVREEMSAAHRFRASILTSASTPQTWLLLPFSTFFLLHDISLHRRIHSLEVSPAVAESVMSGLTFVFWLEEWLRIETLEFLLDRAELHLLGSGVLHGVYRDLGVVLSDVGDSALPQFVLQVGRVLQDAL